MPGEKLKTDLSATENRLNQVFTHCDDVVYRHFNIIYTDDQQFTDRSHDSRPFGRISRCARRLLR